MKFTIDKAVLDKFPGLNIGLLVVKGIDNKGEAPEVMELIRQKEKEIRDGFQKDTLSENPKISSWRAAYSSFGAKPKKYKCSVENLYRMILDGLELKHYSKLVDIYNYISIRHMVPVGGDDIGKVDGGIKLTMAKGTEPYTELNSDETKSPREGEVVYMDYKEVLCRRWNWRECDKTKMTEATTSASLVIEGLPPVTEAEVKAILEELKGLILKHCGGNAETHILNKGRPEAEI
jgi:DNA/RNA-binding domain of Phe-tRNA-synthetase-like protein